MCNYFEISTKRCTPELVNKFKKVADALGFVVYYHGQDRLVFEQWSDNKERYLKLIDEIKECVKEEGLEYDNLLTPD